MLMRSQAPPPPMMMATPPPMMAQQPGPQQQHNAWGGDFQAFVEGKGKAREASPQMQQQMQQQPMNQYTPQMGYTPYVPRFQPLSHTTYAPQPFQQQQPQFQQPVHEQVDTAKLDAEFERALAEHQELEASQTKDAAQDKVADDGELQSALAQPREGQGQPDFEA
jgi:hypothetical protein